MPGTDDPNSWGRYEKLVVAELERLGAAINALSDKINTNQQARGAEIFALSVEVATLKERARMQGAIFGGLVGAIVSVVTAIAAAMVRSGAIL